MIRKSETRLSSLLFRTRPPEVHLLTLSPEVVEVVLVAVRVYEAEVPADSPLPLVLLTNPTRRLAVTSRLRLPPKRRSPHPPHLLPRRTSLALSSALTFPISIPGISQ